MRFDPKVKRIATAGPSASSCLRRDQMISSKSSAAEAATLAVPAAIAGIYGMNFKYMPELEGSYGYPAVLLLTLAIFVALRYLFRRISWL
jgi:magnesium transporter